MKPKPLRLSLILLLIMMSSVCLTQAQEQSLKENPSPQNVKTQTNYLVEQLGLNIEQAENLLIANQRYAEKVSLLKQKNERKTKEFKVLDQSREEDLSNILTKEQYAYYLQLNRENIEHAKEKNKEILREEEQRLNKKPQLKLSPKQKKQMDAIKSKYGKKLKIAKQKEYSQEKREEIRNLLIAQDKEIKAILTEEQFEKYVALKRMR